MAGKRLSDDELCAAIGAGTPCGCAAHSPRADNVTAEELQAHVRALLATPLSYSVYGNMAGLPSYDELLQAHAVSPHHHPSPSADARACRVAVHVHCCMRHSPAMMAVTARCLLSASA